MGQEAWLNKINQALADSSSQSDQRVTRILEKLPDYPDIPRKRAKLINFLKSSLKVNDQKVCEAVWNFLENAKEKSSSPAEGNEEVGSKAALANGDAEKAALANGDAEKAVVSGDAEKAVVNGDVAEDDEKKLEEAGTRGDGEKKSKKKKKAKAEKESFTVVSEGSESSENAKKEKTKGKKKSKNAETKIEAGVKAPAGIENEAPKPFGSEVIENT